MNRKQHYALGLLVSLAMLAGACGTGGPVPPKGGTPEWYWAGVLENLASRDFEKAIDNLNNLAGKEGDFKNRAIVFRTAIQVGLTRGYMEFADAVRDAVEAEADRAPEYATVVQQVNRDARQAAIDLAESLAEVDKAFEGGITLNFPFPEGSPDKSDILPALAKGDRLPPGQLPAVLDHTVQRGLILAVTELAGKGEDAAAAKAAFDAGPVNVDEDTARMALAKMLLDVSLIFDRKRVNAPDVRTIVIDRAEEWAKPYAESENAEQKAWAEQFAKEVEDERRSLVGKARREKKRE